MFQAIRQFNVVNKIFNVRSSEWPKVIFAWSLRFLYRFSFVIGWTVLVALFVSRYGILNLPYLFVLNAIFSVVGSLIYNFIQDKFERKIIIIFTIFFSAVLGLSSNLFFVDNAAVFFGLLIITIGLFLTQLKIILSAYLEEFFNAIESERTFPLIESAETIGGILAGLTIFFLTDVFQIFNFIYLLVVPLVIMVPFILWHKNFNEVNSLVKMKNHESDDVGFFTELKSFFKKKNFGEYFKGLIWIVLLQWFIFNLLEFQYTKAVYSNVSEVILEAGSGFEHAFIHDLGILFVLFSTSALIIQFFVGSRLLNYLGVVGGLILHPLITLFSLLGLTVHFHLNTAVLAKNNFTVSSVIHNNAYHVSYYVLKENFREKIREFLEGIIRPLGAIIGTTLLIFLEYLFHDKELIFAINVLMIVATLFFFYVTYRQRDKYTQVAVNDLDGDENINIRKNALDILTQRGHRMASAALKKIIFNQNELISLRIRAIRALATPENTDTVLDLIKCFEDENPYIRTVAIDTLLTSKNIFGLNHYNLYEKYILVVALKKLYKTEKNDVILKKIIYLMSLLSSVATVEFLFEVLNDSKSSNRVEAIYALGKYKDPEIAKIISSFLNSAILSEQINAAIALWSFGKIRNEAKYLILSFLYSSDSQKIVQGLFALGELKLKSEKYLCFKYLKSEDPDLQVYSTIALAKLGHISAMYNLAAFMLSDNLAISEKVKSLLNGVDVRIYKFVDKIVKQVVNTEIAELKLQYGELTLDKLSADVLLKLKRLYMMIDEYDEVDKINLMRPLIFLN